MSKYHWLREQDFKWLQANLQKGITNHIRQVWSRAQANDRAHQVSMHSACRTVLRHHKSFPRDIRHYMCDTPAHCYTWHLRISLRTSQPTRRASLTRLLRLPVPPCAFQTGRLPSLLESLATCREQEENAKHVCSTWERRIRHFAQKVRRRSISQLGYDAVRIGTVNSAMTEAKWFYGKTARSMVFEAKTCINATLERWEMGNNENARND